MYFDMLAEKLLPSTPGKTVITSLSKESEILPQCDEWASITLML